MKRFLLPLLTLFSAGSAFAVDGVLEINQLCVATGCFAGDTPGFPVQLASNGSYRLTSQLTVPDENTTAIIATADLVTLDLNGFTILGPVNCFGQPVTSCNFTSGSGVGVRLNASGNSSGSTVKNGLIQGMGNTGVSCVNCTIVAISSRSNRLNGFNQSGGGVLSGSSAIANGQEGYFGSGSVENSVAHHNGRVGFFSTDGLIRGCTARVNGNDGIQCLRCSALDNLSFGNGRYGFYFYGSANSITSSWGRNSSYGNTTGPVFGFALKLDNNRCDAALCP